jgi:hypothetical protein
MYTNVVNNTYTLNIQYRQQAIKYVDLSKDLQLKKVSHDNRLDRRALERGRP